MVGKSVKLSPKNSTQDLSPFTSNLKVCGKKGAFPSRRSGSDLGKDLSDIPDAEVVRYLNNKNEVLLKKMAWELMNPDYEKGKQSKPTTVKKKDPIYKTAPTKKTSAARTESNAESENKKMPSSMINYDVLDKLFDAENSPKSAKLKKPVADEMVCSQQNSEDSLLRQQVSEEDEEQELNEDYSNEYDYGGVGEYNGDEDLEFEDQDQLEDNEGIIW